VLFTPEASVDTGPLLRELRHRFSTEPFTISEAEDFTLFDTPFRHDPRCSWATRTARPT
jgi:hypothetical protein